MQGSVYFFYRGARAALWLLTYKELITVIITVQ